MSSNIDKDAREGGRERPKVVTSGLSGEALRAARNSSGAATAAASILDLRVKLNNAFDFIETLCDRLGDAELKAEVKQYRQRATRVDRRER